MPMKEQLDFLYAYNRWASELMWTAIHQLTEEQWQRPMDYSQGSVHDHVVHMMYAPTRWLYSLQGHGKMPALEPKQFFHWREAETRWEGLWNDLYTFVFAMQEDELQRVIPWGPSSRGFQGNTPVWQILTHLVTHTLDHRAQIFMLMNTQFGVATPEQDIFFYFNELGESARMNE
jgi:uncharacterized damage-inducible protein DinB